MYTPYTLYPNGAFMICEDVGEFDPNMPTPEAPPPVPASVPEKPVLPENPEIQAEARLKAVATTGALTYDPLAKLLSRLAPVYEQHIKPLMNSAPAGPDEAIAQLEAIGEAITTVAMALRACIVKYSGISHLMANSTLGKDLFIPHTRTIIQNWERIQKVGLDQYNYTIPDISGLSSGTMLVYLTAIVGNPTVMERPITKEYLLHTVGHYDTNFANTFGGIREFLTTTYEDPTSLQRLGQQRNRDLMANYLLADEDLVNDRADAFREDRETNAAVLRFISWSLRDIKTRCYDLQCDVSSGAVNPDTLGELVEPLINRVINLFGFGTIVALHYAEEIAERKAEAEAADAYLSRILAELQGLQGSEMSGTTV